MRSLAEMNKPPNRTPAQPHNRSPAQKSQLHGCITMTVGHLYTFQLSRIMRESHACGLKTSISRIKNNFSRLTHKSRMSCSLKHMINSKNSVKFLQKGALC